VEGVKHLLLSTKTVSLQIVFGCFIVQGECTYNLAKEIAGYICDGFECRWLEILKTGMVEDLAYCSLKSGATDPRRHDRAIFRYGDSTDVLFHKRLRVVFLELILICLGDGVSTSHPLCS
jgi:hypothetical protein